MENLKDIIKIVSTIFGIVTTILFLITGKSRWGLWTIIMGQISYYN